MIHRYSIQVPILCDVVVEAESSRDALTQVALMHIEGLKSSDVIAKAVVAEVDAGYHSYSGHQYTKAKS